MKKNYFNYVFLGILCLSSIIAAIFLYYRYQKTAEINQKTTEINQRMMKIIEEQQQLIDKQKELIFWQDSLNAYYKKAYPQK